MSNHSPPTATIRMMLVVLLAEIDCFAREGRPLPHCRQAEVADSIFPLVADAQVAWNALSKRNRMVLDGVRAEMLVAFRRGRELPSAANQPIFKTHRQSRGEGQPR